MNHMMVAGHTGTIWEGASLGIDHDFAVLILDDGDRDQKAGIDLDGTISQAAYGADRIEPA